MQQSFRDFWRNRFSNKDEATQSPAVDDPSGREEACQILGVAADATEAEIQAAFRRRAKETHPDQGASSDTAAFRAAVEARDRLLREARHSSRQGASDGGGSSTYRSGPLAEESPEAHRGDSNRGDDCRSDRGVGPDRFPPWHPVSVLRAYLEWRNITILFNGKFLLAGAPRQAKNRADIGAYLAIKRLDDARILDDLHFECLAAGIPLKKSDAQAALREEKADAKHARKRAIIEGLLEPRLTDAEAEEAARQWNRLGTAFKLPADVAAAELQNFVHQVLSKALGRAVDHHLTPIIFSADQNTGKTCFAKRFLRPLKDLWTGPTPLSQIADPRSMQIFSFLAILVDDPGSISGRQVDDLKSVLTADEGARRRMNTSDVVHFNQDATLFMTSNRDISVLVPDDTGHRRFVMMELKSGNPDEGGDAEIWEILKTTDYELLWRSVNPFEPSPIIPYLPRLAALRAARRPLGLKEWLIALNVDSQEVQDIARPAGLRARGLYELFCAQTRSDMTETRFSREMKFLVADPRVPLGPSDKDRFGAFYPIKLSARAA